MLEFMQGSREELAAKIARSEKIDRVGFIVAVFIFIALPAMGFLAGIIGLMR